MSKQPTPDCQSAPREALPDQADPDNPFTVHEALHTAYVLSSSWNDHICQHPALINKPEIDALATAALEAMCGVYQALGEFSQRESE